MTTMRGPPSNRNHIIGYAITPISKKISRTL